MCLCCIVSSPCEINNGGCDQICVNGRQGLVICKCRENYNLLSDFKTCLLSDLFQCPDYCEHGVCTEGPREPQCKYKAISDCDAKLNAIVLLDVIPVTLVYDAILKFRQFPHLLSNCQPKAAAMVGIALNQSLCGLAALLL